MRIYNYHPVTKEYLGYSEADNDPVLNPDRDENGAFLIPDYATQIKPPEAQTGNARVFVNGAWGYVPLSDPDEEPSPDPVPPSSEDVNRERDWRINYGFIFNGIRFQSDVDARENIAGAAQAAFGAMVLGGAQAGNLRWSDPDNDFQWIAEDNTRIPMDAPTMYQFGLAALRHKSAHIFAANDLKKMSPIPADYATNPAYWPTM
ncbi:putative tail fiber assembly protein [Rhizobium phage RHph_I4]|nr:putative tail fiber assembly protein [Rhizobium phage RHph_I4]